MFCIHCGSEIPEQALFCVKCGGKIPQQSDPGDRAETDTQTTSGHITPKGRRMAVMVGIVTASVILAGALIIGGISLFSLLGKNNQAAKEGTDSSDSANTVDVFATDTTITETTDTTESTEATAVTISQEELDSITYGQYITDVLTPTYGLANLEMFRLACEWGDESMDPQEFMPEDRKGIVSALTEDMNGDGNLELIVVIAGTFGDPVILNNNDGSSFEIHYDGVEIKVFQIVSGAVQEMLSDNREMVYPEVFAYATTESLQISILDNGTGTYIYVYSINNGYSLWGSDLFRHDIYQVTDTGIHCLESMTTTDGIIYDALDTTGGSMGTETFNIWNGDLIEDYYTAIQNNLTPYGLDCSWMDSYYNDIQVLTESETEDDVQQTYSHARHQLFTPLSAMISDIEVIAMVGGVFEHKEDFTDLFQSYILLNLVDGLIAQPVRSIPFPNAQAEAEYTIISDQWTQDRDNITAGIYTVTTVDLGVVSYYNGTEVVIIEIADGTGGIPYARTYEYVDGQLIYAFIDWAGSGQDFQLYFSNGMMFRMRFDYGNLGAQNRDNAIGDPTFLKLERKSLEEAMLVLAQANGI